MMMSKSTSEFYGTVAVAIHWLSALLILGLLGSGFRAASLSTSDAKETLLMLHAPLGIMILVLTLVRIIWWLFVERRPEPLNNMPTWQKTASKWVHSLFYVVILGMSASGIGMMVLSGAGDVLFGSSGEKLPNFEDYLPRGPHGIGARLMLVLLAFHIGAALYHQIIIKDKLFARMWFRR